MRRDHGDLGRFLDEEVYPVLFERLDTAFPDFGWRGTAQGWVATSRDHTKSLPGEPRPDRVVCNRPFGFLVHGGTATSWTAYVNGGEPPTGRAFVEAVRTLADLVGVAFPERDLTPEEAARHERVERSRSLLETFLVGAQEALRGEAGLDAVDYLGKRGFPADLEELTACGFGVYSCQGEVQAQLVAAGFTAEEVEDSGLLRDKRWTGRLVLPWRDRWGHVATVAARDLTGEAEEGAKYLYLAGHQKPEAFGLDVALRGDAGGRENLVLTEGLLDVVALQLQGLRNVAALGGGGNLLTPERWAALAGYGVKRAVLFLDNDAAGREGTKAALDNALRADMAPEVWVVDPNELGTAKDPDDLLRENGLEAVQAVLNRRTSGNLYRVRLLVGEVTPESPDHERRAVVDRFLDLGRRLRGPRAELDREDALRLVAERTGYTIEALAAQAEDYEARKRREEAERALRRALGDGVARLEDGDNFEEVAASLQEGLLTAQTETLDIPPAFCVDRLLEESARVPAAKRSGWDNLDKLGVPFSAGELTLLGARPGHAKTSFVANLLVQWLPEAEDELLVFYSAEEPEVAVFRRLLSLLTARTNNRWTTNEVRARLQGLAPPGGDWPIPGALEDAKAQLRAWEDRLLVVHRPGWRVDQLVAHAEDLGRRRRVGAVVVDYLQRVYPPAGFEKGRRRDEELSEIGRRLKSLAVALEAPVVVAAQIGRAAVAETKIPKGSYDSTAVQDAIRRRRPELHHLREGGSEQEADLVLGLLNYRADYSESADESDGRNAPEVTRLEVGSLKNRYGPVGRWAALAFEGRYGLVRDPEPGEDL